MSLIVDPNTPATPGVNPADLIKDSDQLSFAQDVIEASKEVPVIVDFWAPWCGPCKTLGPLLEKLVLQAGGLVKMVKIDVDQNQEIAAQLRVQSVPTVYGFKDGKGVDGFTGAQTESQIKAFIERLTGNAKSPLDEAMEQAKALLDAGDGAAAESLYMQILGQDTSSTAAIAGLIRAKVVQGDTDGARALVGQLDAVTRAKSDVEAAISTIELAEQADDAGDIAPLEAAVAANENDIQARFDLANALYAAGQTERAVDELLECISRDRAWNEEAARQQLLKIFDALGFTDPIAQEGRRKLSTILFS